MLSTMATLFAEVNDLKRITSAGRPGSIATRLFRESWGELVAGGDPESVAIRVTAKALAATRLGDIDRALLSEAGLTDGEIVQILQSAVEALSTALPGSSCAVLSVAIAEAGVSTAPSIPLFVAALEQQPRAGITCPGKPRVVLEPPESHAEHCLVVAVYGVLLSPHYKAKPGRVFLAALAHHFHNAGMPDSGFTGEVLLGTHLAPVMAHFTEACLAELDPPLRAAVIDARAVLSDAGTAEGRAFHAADVIDRVLQINQYMRAGSLTPERVLGEMELVHAGPVKGFQDDVLRQVGLL